MQKIASTFNDIEDDFREDLVIEFVCNLSPKISRILIASVKENVLSTEQGYALSGGSVNDYDRYDQKPLTQEPLQKRKMTINLKVNINTACSHVVITK